MKLSFDVGIAAAFRPRRGRQISKPDQASLSLDLPVSKDLQRLRQSWRSHDLDASFPLQLGRRLPSPRSTGPVRVWTSWGLRSSSDR